MPFQPQVNQQLDLDGSAYRIAEHPAAPGIPYGQEGRQAIVYQLVVDGAGGARALKVFKPRFRVPSLVNLAERLATVADLSGLQVCQRTVLTPQHHAPLLRQHPDLVYGVVMPWIAGPTWMELIVARQPLSPVQSRALARALTETLVQMEQRGIAHGDLSGPNVLLPAFAPTPHANSIIALVDVEQLYAPGLDRPAALPSGSLGYAHKTAADGLWCAEADRFAGAILVAEMLGWCDARVRENAYGENYFDPNELQRASERYRLLVTVLRERYGDALAQMIERAWHSETLTDCATFGEILLALPDGATENTFESATLQPSDAARAMIEQARMLEQHNDLPGAIKAYRAGIAQLDAREPLRNELALILQNLEKQFDAQTQIQQMLQQAAVSEQHERWDDARKQYQAALALAPTAPTSAEWRSALNRCAEEANLAQMFEGGRDALRRGELFAARELLTQVVRARPTYSRGGARATTLLEQTAPSVAKRGRAVGVVAVIAILAILVGGVIGVALFTRPAPSPTPTPVPPVKSSNVVAPTAVPPTNPPNIVAPTQAPTAVPPTSVPPTFAPTAASPTRAPTAVPLTAAPPTRAVDTTPMITIPAGDFLMGSSNADGDAGDDEKPQHTVLVNAFSIDKFEVTNAQYKKCVDAGRCSPPSSTRSATRSSYYGNSQFDNFPVIYVSWNDANTYCAWAGKRLPTEAEWEKAARGTDARIYPWGNLWDGTRLNFCDRNCSFNYRDSAVNDGYADTSPAGAFAGDASPYGVMDLAGNVSEWVADWYSETFYRNAPRSNPTGASSGQYRDVRGGAWTMARPQVRAANRERSASPGERTDDIGFRCVSR
jgi:formylglycine-generating enzyme required for sulfatase activity/tetratricopeptide (TPR) repeat protein